MNCGKREEFMRRKRIIKKMAVFVLVLAMQTSLLAYASEPENEILQEEVDAEEGEPGEDILGTEIPEAEVLGEEDSKAENFEEDSEEMVPGESETPAVSGEIGTPGWHQQGSDWYYYDASGTKAYGWRFVNGAWYYMDPSNVDKPGVMLASGGYMINGQTYFFGESGAMRTGWIKETEGWYYASGSGAMVTGWLQLGNTWYYLDGANEGHPGLMVENGRKVIGDATYFFNGSGAMRTGWIWQEEGWYYSDTVSSVGWKYINGVWYYLDSGDEEYPGRMAADREMNIGGAVYSFGTSGAMRTGWLLKSEGWYYYSGSGAMVTGWLWLGNTWYYLDGADEKHPGLMLDSCKAVLGNATYFFDASGAMRTGWIPQEEGWYYSDNTSSVGWKYVNGAWYYLDAADDKYPGLMLDSCKAVLGNATYFFDSSGAMQTGWIWKSEGWYYANGSGAMVTGWINSGGKWYYLDAADPEYPGRMLASCVRQIGDLTYTFNADGSMRAGWVLDENGDWYYYDTYTGQIKYGWQYIGVAWYYLDPNDGGKMLEGGWHEIGGGWYYMYGSGAMATNWLNLGGKWYYLGGDGAMKTGWQFVDNFWYYMYTQNDPHGGEWGVMASNTSIDGYFLQPNGAMMSAEQYNMYLRAQPYSSSTGYLILVDRAACRVGIFFGSTGAWNLRYFWACSPGKPSTPTVGGEFTVQGKGYYFDSGTSRCYWYTQFYRDYLFHSVLYNKYTGGLDDGRLGMQLSHGCVRLDINNAKWIYDNVPSGTKVVIY